MIPSVLPLLFFIQSPIVFESFESKTVDDLPVYNQVKFTQDGEQDIWMMNQSHHGKSASDWDRLAIVVDRSQFPRTAKFYQLEPGPLQWSKGLKQIEFKVSCGVCHSNGPRAIRPAQGQELTWKQKAQIFAWNLRIKTYGPVQTIEDDLHGMKRKTPFKYSGEYANETLNVASCIRCHSGEGRFSRAKLTRQNQMSIRFMVEKRLMPPMGFSLSSEDHQTIENFLNQ